jgi:hypothetical protein
MTLYLGIKFGNNKFGSKQYELIVLNNLSVNLSANLSVNLSANLSTDFVRGFQSAKNIDTKYITSIGSIDPILDLVNSKPSEQPKDLPAVSAIATNVDMIDTVKYIAFDTINCTYDKTNIDQHVDNYVKHITLP